MKKLLIVLMVCIFCFVGCSVKTSTSEVTEKNENLSKKYNIGDKVELGGVAFNIYKIDNNAGIYLLAQSSVATTSFSDEEHSGYNANVYEGSLVEDYVNEFVDDLEDKGITIKSSGIIDKDDLYELGFKHSDGLSGRPYSIDDAPKFVTYEDDFWVGGYCKYNTYSWSYTKGLLDVNPCDEEYGVRPIIIIDPSEIDKKHQSVDSNLTIKGIVDSDCAWTSGGGLENPYDRYYFDCKNMLFKYVFESPKLSNKSEYSMKFIDEKTIQVEGLDTRYMIPANITIVNANKLRVRFLDNEYNNGDYFLNKISEDN